MERESSKTSACILGIAARDEEVTRCVGGKYIRKENQMLNMVRKILELSSLSTILIKKSCDIHIDTGIWISIFINIGSSKNCCFLSGGLHHGGFKPSFHTPGLYAPDI